MIPPSFPNLTQGLGPSIPITGITNLNATLAVLDVAVVSSASSFNSGSFLSQPHPGPIPVRSPVQQPPSSIPRQSQPQYPLLADPNSLVKNLIDFGLLANTNIANANLGNVGGLNFTGRNNTPTPPPSNSISVEQSLSTVKSVIDLERINLTSNDIQR
jgi:hypothetical protein